MTDEEVLKVASDVGWNVEHRATNDYLIKFARALMDKHRAWFTVEELNQWATKRDTITQLARQAEGEEQQHGMWRMHVEDLERFAALVAAAEREACAKACEEMGDESVADQEAGGMYVCAAAIRSRT